MNAAVAPRACRGCGEPGRLYLSGSWCSSCCPHPPQPDPPADSTLAAYLAARGRDTIGTPPGPTVVDERAIASGKRRSSVARYRDAQAATGAPAAPNEAAPPAGADPTPPAVPDVVAGAVARAQRYALDAPSGLEDPYVRPGRQVTSFTAAMKALPKSGTQRRLVLEAIVDAAARGYAGATDVEVAKHLRLSGNSVRPRRGELVELGLVEDSGRTRRHEGNDHIVWAPTGAALAALHRAAPPKA